MYDRESILLGLTTLANEWKAIAIAWHAVLAVVGVAAAVGARPSVRTSGALAALPLLSVSILAALSGNPFNTTVFALIGVVVAFGAIRARAYRAYAEHDGFSAIGWLLIALGIAYPEFVTVNSWADYLYAAPVGVVPCPTLAMITGIALVQGGLATRGSTLVLAVADLFYGVFGVSVLGVAIDAGLVVGGAATIAAAVGGRSVMRAVRSA